MYLDRPSTARKFRAKRVIIFICRQNYENEKLGFNENNEIIDNNMIPKVLFSMTEVEFFFFQKFFKLYPCDSGRMFSVSLSVTSFSVPFIVL